MLKGLAPSEACPSGVGTERPRHISGVQPGLAHVEPLGDFTGRHLEISLMEDRLNGRVGQVPMASPCLIAQRSSFPRLEDLANGWPAC